MLAIGASLLVAASFAGAASGKSPQSSSMGKKTGGTLVVDSDSDVDYTDPQLDYLSTGWQIQYVTQVKLFNFADKNGAAGTQLQPEGAAGQPLVSKDGKTYTFKVKPGFVFSDGKPVTAANYAYAINRGLNPKMSSPAAQFMTDIVVGAQAVVDGKAATASGVIAKGNTLTIKLLKPAPDLIARLSMAFFSAIPLNLPIDPNGVDVYASAGPYYIASRTPNRQIVIKRNPHYKGNRPHNFDQIVFSVGNSLPTIRLNVESGKSDYAPVLDATAYGELAKKYGVNKSQFFVKPQLGVSYLALNHDRPLFKKNVPLEKAINYAVDRHAITVQAGTLAGKRTDQILPPGMNGFKLLKLYPNNPNFAAAKKLASGHTGDGKAVLYTVNRATNLNQAAIYQFDLKQIGLDLEVKPFTRAVQIHKEGTRGEPFDMTVEGWIADYPDPFDFINILLDGTKLTSENNVNVAYYNNPKYVKAMQQASLLSGQKRYTTYGQLDDDIMTNDPPWAAIRGFNTRDFVSSRIGCYVYPPGLAIGLDYAAACLK